MKISIEEMDELDDVLDKLSEILTTSEIEEFEEALIKNDFDVINTTRLRGFKISPKKRNMVIRLMKELDREERFSLTLALRHMKEKKRIRDYDINLCWTGPKRDVKVRRTEQAISSILNRSECSIDIIGYYMTSHAKRFISTLEKKLKEGVKVRIIIDDLKEKENIMTWLNGLDEKPIVYDWSSDDETKALHTKCVVGDEKSAYIGSSNFTYHGMRKNLEIGLLIKDEFTIEKIERLIENTIDESERLNL